MTEQRVYEILDELNIAYNRFAHIPVYTVAEASGLNLSIPGGDFKNLFIRNRKGDKYYLVIMRGEKRLDLKKLGQQIGESGLSFASPERLLRILGLTPGSVTPFGLINDQEKQVQVIIDSSIREDGMVNFHPNVNTATIAISYGDWMRFLRWCGNTITVIPIN